MHKVGCLDAVNETDIIKLFGRKKAVLAIHDPPYNFIAFKERELKEFINWCKTRVENSYKILKPNSALYI